MKVLVLGHRVGISKALAKLDVPFLIWTPKTLKNKTKALKVIEADFPKSEEDFFSQLSKNESITHVIASGEHAVIPASKIRRWLEVRRNPHSVILKCTDKYKMKKYLAEKGVATTKFLSTKALPANEVVKELGLPVVCKVKLSSGGRGVEFLNSFEEVENAPKTNVYFEKAIKGKEGSIESFIVEKKVIFSSMTKYHINGACNIIPANYEKELEEKILELNQQVISALNIKWGITHLEYYMTEEGILFGEVALRPPGGYIMEVLELVYEQSFWEIFVKVELGFKEISIAPQKNFASSIVIHPGEGQVEEILGLEEIKTLKSFNKLKLKLKVGDFIQKREGLGEDFGYLYLCSSDPVQLQNDVDSFYNQFKVVLS